MALTTAVKGRNATRFQIGDKNAVLVKVTADNAYPEGGYAFDPATFGIEGGQPLQVIVSVRGGLCGNFDPVGSYDKVNKKLRFSGKGSSLAYTELCACDLTSLIADVLIVEAD
jgi:hypothetical protein